MRLAHLILVHNNPLQLERLVKRLVHSETDIYIHLDKKSDLTKFVHLESLPNVYFVGNRTKVTWGDYSMVKATLVSMEQILSAQQEYSHINLLSGQDYPLKAAAEIQSFLFSNPGKTFMKSFSIYEDWKEAIERLNKYHFSEYNYPLKYRIQGLLNKVLPAKKLPNNLNPYGLSQWFTITPAHARYVINYLKENRTVERFFKMTWGADELVFQTILLNSVWKDNIVNEYLRYIKFPKGGSRPVVFTMEDAADIMISERFYARKFDMDIDKHVLDYIDAAIDKKT